MAQVQQLELPKPTRITADVAVKATAGTLYAIALEGGSDASSLDFHDHASSATGDAVIGITAPFTHATSSSQSTVMLDFTSLGGIKFNTGIFCNWTGTGAVGYAWFI